MEFYVQLMAISTPILGAFLGVIIALLKLHKKRLEEKIDAETQTRRKEMADLKDAFVEGLRVEREFRHDIIQRHDEMFDKLFSEMNINTKIVASILEKLEGHVQNQKTICRINHKWDGRERRKDD